MELGITARTRFDEWVRRGTLPGTPVAVCPGTGSERRLRWTRAQLQAWAWRRVQRHTGGRLGLAVDLGCGYGDWAERLATISRRVIAVDIAPGFVAQTEARLAGAGPCDVRAVCADVRGFVDYDAADLVHLGGVLMYLDDDECRAVLAAVRDRLAPGGVLQQRDWCAINLGRPSRQVRDGLRSAHRTPAQYVALARQAGLRVLEVRRSSSIYGEQLVFATLGLRREAPTRVLAWLPRLLGRTATAYWRRGSVSFFFARA